MHLNPALSMMLATRIITGTTQYHRVSVPPSPALIGVDFFNQALVIHQGARPEFTNVDKFRF